MLADYTTLYTTVWSAGPALWCVGYSTSAKPELFRIDASGAPATAELAFDTGSAALPRSPAPSSPRVAWLRRPDAITPAQTRARADNLDLALRAARAASAQNAVGSSMLASKTVR